MDCDLYEKKIQVLQQSVDNMKKDLEKEKIAKLEVSRKLYHEYIYIEKLLNELNVLEKKYNALKNSKLGKLTLKYWTIKRRRG